MKDLKKLIAVEVVLLFLALCFFPSCANADTGGALPGIISQIVIALAQIPFIGQYVSVGVQVLGIIIVILTAFVTCTNAIAKGLSGVASAAGFESFATGVDNFYAAVWPYLSFFSSYSAPFKPTPKKPALLKKK